MLAFTEGPRPANLHPRIWLLGGWLPRQSGRSQSASRGSREMAVLLSDSDGCLHPWLLPSLRPAGQPLPDLDGRERQGLEEKATHEASLLERFVGKRCIIVGSHLIT